MENTIKHDIKPGDRYKHFKGEVSIILGIGHHSETLEELVIYQAIHDSKEWGPKPIWARPIEDFTGHKTLEDGTKIKRFEKLL